MQQTHESARALVNRAAGPLARYLDPFITSLIEQQYQPSVIYIKARHGLAFDRWLTKRQIVLADLCEAKIVQYQNRTRRRHQRIRAETRHIERKALTQLLHFLRISSGHRHRASRRMVPVLMPKALPAIARRSRSMFTRHLASALYPRVTRA